MSLIKKFAKVLTGKNNSDHGSESNQGDQSNTEEVKNSHPPQKKTTPNKGSRNLRKRSDKNPKNRRDDSRTKEKSQTKEGTRKHKSHNARRSKTSRKPDHLTKSKAKAQSGNKKQHQKFIEPVDPVGFKDLGLCDEILTNVGKQGYSHPTPIQKASIADLVKGRDLLGCAQTGTGKTASFALPTLQRLSQNHPKGRPIRNLVLTPTRELAIQVGESYVNYGRGLDLEVAVIFGGVGAEPQKKALKHGVDVLVATPGRLLDLHEQGFINFDRLEILVLDEADRMLDMGFLPDVKRIIKLLPPKRQNILFSATMPADIADLSMRILRDPIKVEVTPVSSTAEKIDQTVYCVNRKNKRDLLLYVLEDPKTFRILIFTRTKAIANRVTTFLTRNNITAEAIHGNKSQSARQRALENFKISKTRVLVASDLAARGLDVDDISHVINYDLPDTPETYVHRIGRTGRAKSEGKAISFCTEEDMGMLRDIEKLIGKHVERVHDHPFPMIKGLDEPRRAPGGSNKPRRGRGGPPRGRRGGSNRNKK